MDHQEGLNALPELTIELIRHWLSDCVRSNRSSSTYSPSESVSEDGFEHDLCNITRGSFIPTRILYLGRGDLQSDLRLLTKEQVLRSISYPTHDYQTRFSIRKRHIPPYATLSHRWAGSNIIRTDRANLEERCSRIAFTSLNQVFKKAVVIARQLGVHYLWIDSLCIIQDCKADWEREAQEMGYVYRNALLNIADASLATGEDLEYLEQLEDADGNDEYLSDEEEMPDFNTGQLESRGWVLQERILAPATIYFGGPEVRWICRHAEFSESNPKESIEHLGMQGAFENGLQYGGNLRLRFVSRFLALSAGEHTFQDPDDTMWLWLYLVDCYSRRRLTVETDRLAALSGCAKLFEKALGKPYLAGLWMNYIDFCLLWKAKIPAERPTRQIAPSWSWACIGSPVQNLQRASYFFYPGWKSFIDVLSYKIYWSENNPYGSVSPQHLSYLELHGRIVNGQFDENDGVQANRVRTVEIGFIYVHLDYKRELLPDCETVWLLIVASSYSDDSLQSMGLVLTEAKTAEIGASGRAFRRIGFWSSEGRESEDSETEDSETGELKTKWNQIAKETIVLI